MGGSKLLVHVRIVVAATFDFMTEEDWVVARTKAGNGGGEGRKKSLLSIRPLPLPLPLPFFREQKRSCA